MNTDVLANRQRPNPPRGQRGVVLLIALIALAALSVGAISLIRSADTGGLVSGNMAFRQSALLASDLGVEAAVTRLQGLVDTEQTTVASANFSPLYDPTVKIPASLDKNTANEIEDADTGTTSRFWIERLCLAAGAPTRETCNSTASAGAQIKPFYRATVRVDGARGTSAFTQVMFALGKGLKYAIVAKGTLKIESDVDISGNGGSVYATDRVMVNQGATDIAGEVISSGDITGMSPAWPNSKQNQPLEKIPEYRPADYQKYARFRLGADGKVYERGRVGSHTLDTWLASELMILDSAGTGGKWFGWKASSNCGPAKPQLSDPPTNWSNLCEWKLEDDNSRSNDLIYVEGNALIGSSPGEKVSADINGYPSPWKASLIAMGDIVISGNPYFEDFVSATNWDGSPTPKKVNDFAFLAGVDLHISGNFVQTGPEAMFSALDQVVSSGSGGPNNATASIFRGAFVSSKHWGTHQWGKISDPVAMFSGTARITYSGGLGGDDTVQRVAWREVVE